MELIEGEFFIKVFVDPAKSAEPPTSNGVLSAILLRTMPEASLEEQSLIMDF